MKKTFLQLIRYVMVGAASTVADYGAYLFFTRITAMPALEANPLAYAIGNIVSFYGHRIVTFRSRGKPMAEYARFAVVSIAGLLVSQIVVAAALYVGISDLVGKAASIIISGMFNYLMNRYWTFRPTGHRP